MPSPTRHVLVVACLTAGSRSLRAALRERARREPTEFTLLMPAPPAAGEAGALIRAAVERLRADGLDVAGLLGEADPCAAVEHMWDPAEYDEIVVATLARERSHWLEHDLPARLEGMTGVPVEHVVAGADEC
jgi:hypothetical protein